MAAKAAKTGMLELARSFRAALLRQERAQQAEMVRQWLGIEERLMDQIMVLVYQLQSEDSPKSLHQIVMMERYQRLLAQVQAELGQYSQDVIVQVQRERDEWARRGFENGQMMVWRSLEASAMGVGLDQLPVEAVTNLTAWSGEGTALGQLLQGAFLPEGLPRGWTALQRTLVQGLALGWHPEKTAREMARALAGGLQRAMVVARTEQIRAYRSGSLQAYQESGVVIGHKRLTAHDSRVCAACLADEGHVYGLDEMMWSHPQCRCTSVPVLRGAEEPQWELGEEWLRRQDPATQNQIFGSWAAADAFRRGIPLKEFMRVTNEGDWGMTLRQRSGQAFRVQNPVLDGRTSEWFSPVYLQDGVYRMGELKPAIIQAWGLGNESVLDVVVTAERRAHYLERHPELKAVENLIPQIILDPTFVVRNKSDLDVLIFYYEHGNDFLRAAIRLQEATSDRKHSLMSARYAHQKEVLRDWKRAIYKKRKNSP